MTFPINTTVPASGNNPSNDQQPMQTNFANINSYLGVDHTTPGTNPGDGQHNQVTFHINQAAPSIANGVSGLFANTANGGSQLFFQNGVQTMQISNSSLNPALGQGMLPGGVQIRAGNATATSGGNPVSITPAFPNNCIAVVVSFIGSGFVSNVQTCSASINSASQFTAYSSAASNAIYYIAIGY